MPGFTHDDVELAERYRDVLQEIAELQGQVCIDEAEVEQANDYLGSLQAIQEMDSVFTEDDVDIANRYLATLQEIEEAS